MASSDPHAAPPSDDVYGRVGYDDETRRLRRRQPSKPKSSGKHKSERRRASSSSDSDSYSSNSSSEESSSTSEDRQRRSRRAKSRTNTRRGRNGNRKHHVSSSNSSSSSASTSSSSASSSQRRRRGKPSSRPPTAPRSPIGRPSQPAQKQGLPFGSPPLPSSSTLLVPEPSTAVVPTAPFNDGPLSFTRSSVSDVPLPSLPPGAVLMDRNGVVARAPLVSPLSAVGLPTTTGLNQDGSAAKALSRVQVEMQQDRSAFRAEIDRLSAEVEQRDEEIARLKCVVNNWEPAAVSREDEDASAVRLREAATGVELIATKRELAELREEYNYMAAKLAETGDAPGEAPSASSGEEVLRLQTQLKRATAELERANVEIATLNEKLSSAKATIADLERARTADAANIRLYVNENDALRKRMSGSDERVSRAESQVQHCKVQIGELGADLEARRSENAKLKAQIAEFSGSYPNITPKPSYEPPAATARAALSSQQRRDVGRGEEAMRQRRDDVIGSGRAEEASYQRRDVVVRDVALPLRQEYGRFEESQLGRRVEAVAVPDRSEAERAEAVAPERRDVVRGGEVSSDADAASFLLQQRALALQRVATKGSVGPPALPEDEVAERLRLLAEVKRERLQMQEQARRVQEVEPPAPPSRFRRAREPVSEAPLPATEDATQSGDAARKLAMFADIMAERGTDVIDKQSVGYGDGMDGVRVRQEATERPPPIRFGRARQPEESSSSARAAAPFATEASAVEDAGTLSAVEADLLALNLEKERLTSEQSRLERQGGSKTRSAIEGKAVIAQQLADVEARLSKLRLWLKKNTKT